MGQRLSDYRVFWREFRQQYHTTGALLPSGRALARALASFVRTGEAASADGQNGVTSPSARRILEVGPGTGAVTREILAAVQPTDDLTLVELNDQFVEFLRNRLNDDPAFRSVTDRITLIHANVLDLPEDQPYDLIISGLPLNNFDVAFVEQILAKLKRVLAPGGTLSFFEYVAVRKAKSLISGRDQRERLQGITRIFNGLKKHEVRRDLVVANVTPAWVHHIRFAARSEERGARSEK
jgi:phosphatidylethanolamine/phosphatidyl-N-methylethanolamine N-methyltransferase